MAFLLALLLAACSHKGQQVDPASTHVAPVSKLSPCDAANSRELGVVVAASRASNDCALLEEYLDWMGRIDSLALRPEGTRLGDWDVAFAALRLGRTSTRALVVADSIRGLGAAGDSSLYLSLLDLADSTDSVQGQWYVPFRRGEAGARFRSALDTSAYVPVLHERGVRVLAATGAKVSPEHIRQQIDSIHAWRRALALEPALPPVTMLIAADSRSLLGTIGILSWDSPLDGMTLYSPLVILSVSTAQGGVIKHEAVHVAAFTPDMRFAPGISEALALVVGGTKEISFSEVVCRELLGQPASRLGMTAIDSLMNGAAPAWMGRDFRAMMAGMAVYIGTRDRGMQSLLHPKPNEPGDLAGTIALRLGMERGELIRAVASETAARRQSCAQRQDSVRS